MASSPGAGLREQAEDCPKRQQQKPVTTYVVKALFDAMHEVAWRKRLTFAAALAEAMQDFVEKPIKPPKTKPEHACANRHEKRKVTAYLDPPLAKRLHETAWKGGISLSTAAARAIRDYAKKHSKTPAPV